MKGNVKKEQKKKPCHSVPDNAVWSFREMLCCVPQSFWLMAAGVPLSVFLAWTEIRLPALVVSEVAAGEVFAHAAAAVGLLIGLMFAAAALKEFCRTVLEAYLSRYRYRQWVRLYRKSMRLFYQTYEKKPVRDLLERAMGTIWMNEGVVGILEMPRKSMDILQNILCYALFGTVISFVSPWLVVLLTLAPMVNWFCIRAYHRYEYRTRAERTDIARRKEYVADRAGDFTAAKDIRVYGMTGWLKRIFGELADSSLTWEKRLRGRQLLARLADLCVILVRDGAAYAVLIAMSLDGKLTPAQFVLYFAAISGFAGYVGNIMNAWNELHAVSLSVCDFREYICLPDEEEDGLPHAGISAGHAPEITFDHVTFRYEGAEKNTLDDISLTLRAGERVALVGMNGAGKTTLVKLLCGLYAPTSGQIRIDGIPAADYPRSAYYRLFSPVFQDVQTAFFSLAETVACDFGEKVDRARAEDCMRRAGLGKKLDSLPRGIDTCLDKQINEGGIELSGGEAQKLMMARALYKDAPVLVLDEPTAALDPIAENEIYLKYRDMTEGKTSLFISHRLASTQFCDRILFLRDGKIAEEGSHEELIRAGGDYAGLYEIQSCWYREDYRGGELHEAERAH